MLQANKPRTGKILSALNDPDQADTEIIVTAASNVHGNHFIMMLLYTI